MTQLPVLLIVALGILCFYAAAHCRGHQHARAARGEDHAAARFAGASIGLAFGGCLCFSTALAFALGGLP